MIYDWIRQQAERNPDAPAITLDETTFTFGFLESQSNRFAEMLLSFGLRPLDRVGLLLEKRPETVIAMLGISKAGGVYVPLDIHSPVERLSKILISADPTLMMVDRHSWSKFAELINKHTAVRAIPWIWWDEDLSEEEQNRSFVVRWSDLTALPNIPHEVTRKASRPAHILFTSGSTGNPKGVVISHRNIQAFIHWAISYFQIQFGDRISGHAPLHFDLSTFDIYGAMASGAHLFMVPAHMSVMPNLLTQFIHEQKLVQWFSVPSVLNYMARFEVVPEQGFPHLKRLIWCGEVFPVPALQYWMKHLPGVTFTNLYGPTEATIASSFYTLPAIPESNQDIPIGTACEGEQLLVLDDQMQPLKKGKIGDLYIGGKGVSPGYWRDPEKTSEAFVDWTNKLNQKQRIYRTGDLASMGKDGLFYFHGRSDYQIKSRGYRIELGEIESAIDNTRVLRECAVVPVEKGGFEGTSIGCAYVCKESDHEFTPTFLKKLLAQKIPQYMMPQYWSNYDQLPRNGNGKIDRKQLSETFEESDRKYIKVQNTQII